MGIAHEQMLDAKKLTWLHKTALFFAPVSVGLLLLQTLPSGYTESLDDARKRLKETNAQRERSARGAQLATDLKDGNALPLDQALEPVGPWSRTQRASDNNAPAGG